MPQHERDVGSDHSGCLAQAKASGRKLGLGGLCLMMGLVLVLAGLWTS